ncbi:hypothetical protein BaRGS_00008573 [Batillaria attramentaria]|uniref:Uncharacterized protein n=1 Tax=Batillaria attramentaria TaxID=370345 RepID=A0ABD0LL98_9CAEN
MPTAVVRQSFPWKPGNHVSFAPGEGTLASEDRLPCVTQTNGHASGPSPTGNRDGTGPGGRGMSSSGTGQGSGSSTEVKRFPILGPTRQDTEVYFKVRSTRTR